MMIDSQVVLLNSLVAAGKVKYADGNAVDKPLSEGLITTDGQTIYRIDDDIPVMLIDQAIVTSQLEGW